jgi:RNA polymerase sigma-70 factor (ECF subfamily)
MQWGERRVSSSDGSDSRIERARRGEEDAIGALYAELAPGVAGYLRGSGVRDVEDLVGDVFVSMIRGLAGFRGDEAALRRWVFTIAHHRLVDELRKDAVRAAHPPGDERGTVLPEDLYDQVLDRIDAAPAVSALAHVTREQRDAVLLRSVVELSVADTAAVLHKTPGAVKTLHRRALAALTRLVDGETVS